MGIGRLCSGLWCPCCVACEGSRAKVGLSCRLEGNPDCAEYLKGAKTIGDGLGGVEKNLPASNDWERCEWRPGANCVVVEQVGDPQLPGSQLVTTLGPARAA